MKRKALIIAGWIISLIFLYFAFKDIHPEELWNSLKTANYWWVIPNVTTVMIAMLYRAYRWQIMLDPIKRVKLNHLFASTMVGFMANNVLPLRMGEFVRAYSIGKTGDISRSSSFATIVLERIFDIFMLLLMLVVILLGRKLPLDPEGPNYDRIVYAGWMMLIISLTLFVLLVFLRIQRTKTLSLLSKVFKVFPKRISELLLDIFNKFAEGLDVLSDARRMISIFIHSVLLWIITGISNYFVFLAFGLDALPWEASFVVLIVVTLGITLPNAPGYIGLFHGLVILALSFYPLEVPDPAVARGVAIVLHGAQYIVITLIGLYYLYRNHLSLHEAREEAGKNL